MVGSRDEPIVESVDQQSAADFPPVPSLVVLVFIAVDVALTSTGEAEVVH